MPIVESQPAALSTCSSVPDVANPYAHIARTSTPVHQFGSILLPDKGDRQSPFLLDEQKAKTYNPVPCRAKPQPKTANVEPC